MIRNFLVALFLFASFTVIAQRTSSSPYSFFGIGDEFSNRTVEQNAMGGIGVAFGHYKYLNFTNPAAYAFLRYTTYSLGALNNDLTIKTNSTNQSSTSTNLSYVAFAFPVGKKAAFSIGMQPLSSIGYSLTNSTNDANGNLEQISLFQGNGGVNRIYGALGAKIFNNLALGVEADFSFGRLENSVTNQRANVSLGTRYTEESNVRGGAIKFGLLYEHELKDKLMVTAGASVRLASELSVEGEDNLFSVDISSEVARDTLSNSLIDGSFNLPLKSVFGVGVGKLDKWFVSVEYENQNAFSTSGILTNSNGAFRYDNANRISFGGYYLPKINSISSYWDRITYRAGVRFEKTGLLIDGTGGSNNFSDIRDFGISFGLGLPLKRLSSVNLGFEFGKRGTIENNLVEENYFNLRLSLSLTDINWFVKRKID